MPSLRPGETVGRYKILEEISRGGTAVVYRAIDTGTDSAVALKLLQSPLDHEQRARLEREARVLRTLSHPNLSVIHETGEVKGCPFIVFELLTGGTLADEVARRGRLPWTEAARHGARIASALATLHDAGLVHRDVKPANVILDERGQARLADLGIVRVSGTAFAEAGSLTGAGEILGTLEFISPEQANASRDLDARADLYSLGATLHALVAGQPPFQGEGYVLVRSHLLDPPPALSELVADVPTELETLVLDLLEKDPADRPGSAREVMTALDAIADGTASSPRTSAVNLVVAAFLIVVALGAGAVVTMVAVRERQRKEVAAAVAELKRVEDARVAAEKRLASDKADVAAALLLGRTDPRGALARLESLASAAKPQGPVELAARLARTQVFLDLFDADAALVEVDRALKIESSPAAHALHAQALATKGDHAGAMAEAEAALALDSRCARAVAIQAVGKVRGGDRATARVLAHRATEIAPDDAFTWECFGIVLQVCGESAAALGSLDRAVALGPTGVSRVALRGQRRNGGDLVGACADYARVAELCPDRPEGWYSLATGLEDQGDDEGALAQLARAPAAVRTAALVSAARIRALEALGRLREAVEEADQAVGREDNATTRTTRADVRIAIGAYGGGLDDATRATELEGKNSVAWAVLGEVRRRLHRPDAKAALQKAGSLDPTYVPMLVSLGLLHVSEAHLPEAKAFADRAIALAPRDAGALGLRCRVRLLQNDRVGADEDARLAIKTSPSRTEGWTAYAVELDDGGAFAEAIQAATRALEHGVDEDARLVRAIGRSMLGQNQAALEDAEVVLRTAPDELRALAVRAQARRLTGDAEGAKSDELRMLAAATAPEPAYVRGCEVTHAARDFPFVIALAQRGLTRFPDSRELPFLRATGFMGLRRYEEAQPDLDRAVVLIPTASTFEACAMNQIELGRFADAVKSAQRAWELEPATEEINWARCITLVLVGRYPEANGVVNEWAATHGGGFSGKLVHARAELRARMGDLAGAQSDADALLASLPTALDVQALRAEVKRRRGDLDGAVADAEVVLSHHPDEASSHTTRGLVREARGDLAGARADLVPYASHVSRAFFVHDVGVNAAARLSKDK